MSLSNEHQPFRLHKTSHLHPVQVHAAREVGRGECLLGNFQTEFTTPQ